MAVLRDDGARDPTPARPIPFPRPPNAYERRQIVDHLEDDRLEQLPPWGDGKLHPSNFGGWLARISESDLRELVDVVRSMMVESICPDEANGTRERTFHSDLPNLRIEQLLEERDRVRLRALVEPKPSSWIRERARKINQEIVTRRGRPSPGGDASGRT